MNEQQSRKNTSDKIISRALRVGVWISSLLMGAGLFVSSLQSSVVQVPEKNPSLIELVSSLFSKSMLLPRGSEAITLLYAGLVTLMLTPFVRVFAAAIAFGIQKDWKFVGISLVVLFMLVGELVLSLR